MRIVNQMPFVKCENCERCVLSVRDNINECGEMTVYATCRHAQKCLNRKKRGKKDED